MINNLEKIKEIITFQDENDFYFVQILKRKKKIQYRLEIQK